MSDAIVTVHGTTGSPVVLLAGGAASSHGFFPGLVEALAGHRVLEVDRPGTGRAAALGTARLATGSAAIAQAITDLGAGPAVVVGQSLGGLQAVHLAVDHPELVAGLVLVDPTPHDQPDMVPLMKRVFSVFGAPAKLPVVGGTAERIVWRLLSVGSKVAPESRTAHEVMTSSASLAQTADAITDLADEMRALTPRVQRLDVPVVLLTAQRKPGHKVRQSHERLVAALGGRVVAPAGAVHADHLRDPKGVNDLVVSVVAEAAARV